jgi:hypothetical protein
MEKEKEGVGMKMISKKGDLFNTEDTYNRGRSARNETDFSDDQSDKLGRGNII